MGGRLDSVPVPEFMVDPGRYLVPDLPITVEHRILRSRGQVGIRKPVVDRHSGTRNNRADRMGPVAEGNREIEGGITVFRHGL